MYREAGLLISFLVAAIAKWFTQRKERKQAVRPGEMCVSGDIACSISEKLKLLFAFRHHTESEISNKSPEEKIGHPPSQSLL